MPPAVFITNAPECQYQAFSDLGLADCLLLAGTIVVAFSSVTHTVDLFSIDANGQVSAVVVSIPAK